MRGVFASFGLEPDAPHQPLMLGLQFHQGSATAQPIATMARGLLPPKDDNPSSRNSKSVRFTRPSIESDLVREAGLDIADEPQSQMIIFRIDPARARQAAAQQRQRLARHLRGISRPVNKRGIETS